MEKPFDDAGMLHFIRDCLFRYDSPLHHEFSSLLEKFIAERIASREREWFPCRSHHLRSKEGPYQDRYLLYPFHLTPMVLLLTRFCMILPYPAQFPTKKVKYGSFTQILIPCNNQLPSTIAQIQIIHTEGFQGCLRFRVDTQQLLSTRRSSHGAHRDTGVGHVHRMAPKSIKKP